MQDISKNTGFYVQRRIGLFFNVVMAALGLYYFIDAGLVDSFPATIFRFFCVAQFLVHVMLFVFLYRYDLIKWIVGARAAVGVQAAKMSVFFLVATQASHKFGEFADYIVTSFGAGFVIICFLLAFISLAKDTVKSAKIVREKEITKDVVDER